MTIFKHDLTPTQDEIRQPDFLALTALVGILHVLFGVLCFYCAHQEWLEKESYLLGIFIVITTLSRFSLLSEIFSFKLNWILLSYIPVVFEMIFAIFIFINPSINLSDIGNLAGIFLILCSLIRFIESAFMTAEGLKSFTFANGIALAILGGMIFFKWPSSEFWTGWAIIGIDFLSIGLITLWFTYYAIFSLTRPVVIAKVE